MSYAEEIMAKYRAGGHVMDPLTYNCVACGASYESMLDNVAPVECVPDGKPHPRTQTIYSL